MLIIVVIVFFYAMKFCKFQITQGDVKMQNHRSVKIVSVFVAALFVLIACKPAASLTEPAPPKSGREPVACTQMTVEGALSAGQWDCSQGEHTLTISNLPPGITPYSYLLDEVSLREQKKSENIAEIISIVADIRFFADDDKEKTNFVTRFEKPVQLWIGYNQQDIDAVHALNRKVSDLIPIQIVLNKPGAENIWKTFPEGSVDVSQVKEDVFGGVTITFSTWGDPPAGWGLPK
jgi:hypothetical protein